MTELIFIRHGETDWNRQQRFQGQIDVPQNAIGHLQAQRLAEALSGERFDLLVSSDLQRARQSIAPLEQRLARPARVQVIVTAFNHGVEGETRIVDSTLRSFLVPCVISLARTL